MINPWRADVGASAAEIGFRISVPVVELQVKTF